MILQRMAGAIKRQDWFQVTIEIFIVMIGIFLGLQVQEWNETRKNYALESFYLDSLEGDLTGTLITLENNINAGQDAMQKLVAFHNALKSQTVDDLSEDLNAYINDAGTIAAVYVNTTTISQLIEGDNMKVIRSIPLQRVIHELETGINVEVSVSQMIIETGLINYQNFNRNLDDEIEFEPASDISSNHLKATITSTADEMYENPQLITATRNYIRSQSLALFFANRIKTGLEAALSDIQSLRKQNK